MGLEQRLHSSPMIISLASALLAIGLAGCSKREVIDDVVEVNSVADSALFISKYDKVISDLADEYDIDPSLFRGIIYIETLYRHWNSNGTPITSRDGAKGIGQHMRNNIKYLNFLLYYYKVLNNMLALRIK